MLTFLKAARSAGESGELQLLAEAATALCSWDETYDQWTPQAATQRWLRVLRGPAAAEVADVLRRFPESARHYRDLTEEAGVDLAIAAAMVWARQKPSGRARPPVGVSERRPYPTDLSDGQWSLIEPVLAAWKGWQRSVGGHQSAYAMREFVNSILYRGRTDRVAHELLRCWVRERARRLEDPTVVVLDTRSVHAAAGVPSSTTGRGAAALVPDRKRALAVDGHGRPGLQEAGHSARQACGHRTAGEASRPWAPRTTSARRRSRVSVPRLRTAGARSGWTVVVYRPRWSCLSAVATASSPSSSWAGER
ncbi:hypothetical protein KCH_03620 [Kitasatospora cheerisanensis KCTC 2395]|uniref:Transposase n=1 Tax=Kitasatospora cheerisanensis KCTC 2395 TaxID=1348663 RepID=A0A066ZC78_9ACTN|nr:hypothetical protein KCH_03620 [Kitasatospora cheerisanensis KCTC 2395]